MESGSTSVTTTATSIIASGSTRTNLILTNNGTDIVYIGSDGSVTTSNGFPIHPDERLELGDYYGEVYGIVGSTTSSVAYYVEN